MIRKHLGFSELQSRTTTVYVIEDQKRVVSISLYDHVMKSARSPKTDRYKDVVEGPFLGDLGRDTRYWFDKKGAEDAFMILAFLSYQDL